MKGIFVGDARREKEFLVINGIITYDLIDEYKDPASLVERLMFIFNLSREQAESIVGDSGDVLGEVYPIIDRWQTKFNASVRLNEKDG